MIRTISLPVLALFSLLIWSCSSEANDTPASQPAKSSKTLVAPANALFQYVAPESSGVDFSNRISETHELNIITNSYMYNGGGVALIDINKDQLPDLYFASSQEQNKLYLNTGNFKFEDISEKAGVTADGGFKSGLTIVDINNDDWQDIYVCHTGLQA
ncbi:MAG: VCBS repeat-containing protein, partial [Phaeodactylibacter sp.]|nr:VCBS repeat-containing protein [Phaeodactylibacter sp.]